MLGFFKKYFKSVIVPILLVLISLGFLESWAHKNFKPVTFTPKIRKQIIKKLPHMILIGNSMVGSNIDKTFFQKELKRRTGKDIRVSYVVGGSLHTAWFYLVLKNQIANVVKDGTPIVIIDYEDYFVRPEANTSALGKSETIYRSTMKGHEELFLSKIGSNALYYSSGFPYLYSQRYQIKRWVTSQIVMKFLRITGILSWVKDKRIKKNNVETLSWILSTAFKGSNFRGNQADDRERNDRVLYSAKSQQEFNQKADSSFLPEILSYTSRFPIAFVLSSSNPNMTLVKSSVPKLSSQLNTYITEKGGKFIDMNAVPELQNTALMHDSRHFTVGHGRVTNTKKILDQLEKVGLLDKFFR